MIPTPQVPERKLLMCWIDNVRDVAFVDLFCSLSKRHPPDAVPPRVLLRGQPAFDFEAGCDFGAVAPAAVGMAAALQAPLAFNGGVQMLDLPAIRASAEAPNNAGSFIAGCPFTFSVMSFCSHPASRRSMTASQARLKTAA